MFFEPPPDLYANWVAVRLATRCTEDTPDAIHQAVRALVAAFHDANDCSVSAIKSVIFTATPDLQSAKPAAAARDAGWGHAAMLCLAEMPTDDDLSHCLRVLLFVNRGLGADALRPVYLNGTAALRPDLFPQGTTTHGL